MSDSLKIFGTTDNNVTGIVASDPLGNELTYTHGGSPTPPTPTPTPWVRPADWPDLSQMDVSAGDILYMTSYADEARGFCSFYVNCTGNYTVEVGSISGSTFTADATYTYASSTLCELYYGSANGTYKVLRVTGDTITRLQFSTSSTITIGSFNGYKNNQGIIDIVGKLPSCSFLYCYALYNVVNIKISGLVLSDTLTSLFYSCYSLTSLDVSDWDMSRVTGMSQMFQNCYSLTSLDVSDWDTSEVRNTSTMFDSCRSLTSLDVGSWNMSKVTNMSNMFNYCYSLTSLDVSDWNTSEVTSMSSMFQGCYSLTSLDIGSWNMSKVTNMNNMFSYCTSITSLDVSDWDTSKVTSMSSMFQSCYSLTSLDVGSWDTSSVTNMSNMFYGCYSLTSLDVGSWNMSKVTNMSNMFNYCTSITSLDVNEFDTGLVTNMSQMFQNCFSLTSLDVGSWDTSSVTNISSMFSGCYSLTSLDVSSWDFSKVTSTNNTANTFNNCCGLYGSLTLPSTVTVISNNCFSNCRSLYEWHFKSTTPPTLSSTNAFNNAMTDFGGKKIYVPYSADHSILNAYKTKTNWSTYASYIVEESP